MAKDPAFLFYPGDWLGGTMGMTFEEKGAYLELLMLQFNRGHMTSHMIGQTVGQLWDKLQDKFEQDTNGMWFNERLDVEKTRRKTFTESRKNNINGKNQYNNNEAHIIGHMTSHMENENRNINNNNRYDFLKTSEILNSENEIGWRETIMQVSSVKTDRQLKVFIKEFLLIQKANNYFPHEISDTKRYFLNWVRSKSAVSPDSSVSDVLESKMKVY